MVLRSALTKIISLRIFLKKMYISRRVLSKKKKKTFYSCESDLQGNVYKYSQEECL